MDLEGLIKLQKWAVIGDVGNETKYAYKILSLFKEKGHEVYGVHPKGGEGIYKSLKDLPVAVEAVDLCINPVLGLKLLEEVKELGIKYVLIQPGAESADILKYCKDNGIEALEGCALVGLKIYS